MRLASVFLMVLGLTMMVQAQENEPATWDAAEDLQAMQGKWELIEDRSVFVSGTAMDQVLKEPRRQFSSMRIDGNRLYLTDFDDIVLLANDMHPKGIEVELEDCHLLSIMLPSDGRAFFASYRVEGDQLEIRYPHTAVCSRSGKVAVFKRIHD